MAILLSSWSLSCSLYTSIAARGGGGSFKRLKLYYLEEHVPIESFETTLIHWAFFLMTRTKLAFVGFVAAGNSMWHQVLDDVKVSASLSQISPQRHATLPKHQTVPSTTPYCKVLKSVTPVLFCTTKYYSSTTLYYKVLLQKVLLQYYKVLVQYYSDKVLLQYYFVLQNPSPDYSVLQSTTPVLLHTTKY